MRATAGVLLVGVDPDGRIAEWNLEAERFFDRARARVMGQGFVETCVPAPQQADVQGTLRDVAAGQPSRSFNVSWQGDGGALRWVSWTVTRMMDDEGAPRGLLLIGHDITGFRESQSRWDDIIHSAMDAIITIDDDQHVINFNPAAERMFGCPASEVLGRPIDGLIPERFRKAHREHVKEFGRRKVTARSMGRLGTIFGLRADGEEFPIEASISQAEVGGEKLFTVILRDVTARRVAEDSLQKERDFIAAVLDTAGALVVVLDLEGRIQRFNSACQEVTGYTLDEVKGRCVWDFLLRPEDVAAVRAGFARIGGGGLPSQFENDWVSKDGRHHRIAWTNTVLRNPDGSIANVIGTGLDISALIQTQERLRRTERLAEVGVVASGLAHEIGTPMNVILGRAEYLMQRTTDEGVLKGLATIVRQVERITKIMNQLLAYARRRPAEMQPVSLRRLVEDSLEMIHQKMSTQGVTVVTDIPEDVPELLADADHLSQVLLNLFLNALQAMEGGGTLRVTVRAAPQEIKLAVSDTGHGIAKVDVDKIFEPFYTTKDVGKGTGLGLNVVSGIIQEHKGTISVESEPGLGTTFTITLPTASGEPTASA